MLRELHNQGMSISEIAKETGYNRRTVRKYVNLKVPPVAKKRSPKASKLDNYKDYITQRLNSYPLTASRIYREIQEMGFTGKYTIVKDFIRKVRPPRMRSRGLSFRDATRQTGPGRLGRMRSH